MGNITVYIYDPASNVIRTRRDGDPVDDTVGSSDNKTLEVTEQVHDALDRVIATHRVLFETPDVTFETGSIVEAYQYDPYGSPTVFVVPGRDKTW